MEKAKALLPAFVRTFKVSSLAAATALAMSTPAHALQFEKGGWSGSWDTTVSYGLGIRMEDRNMDHIGFANGGQAASVNSDDGNLNFDKGDIFSNALKLSTELELTKGNYGAFFRVNALYDDVIANDRVDNRPLNNLATNPPPAPVLGKIKFTDDAVDLAGSRIELFDAYLFGEFSAGDRFGSWKFGNQVLSWGESTFIQNSINAVNPIDVTKIRVPGAELKEALIPVPMVSGTLELTENTSLEAFYQMKWEPFRIDPRGAYFSTNDFAGEGGGTHGVLLGFGANSENGTAGIVARAPDREARDDGQLGIAYRVFAPELNDTEFGFFFMNYHSRLPAISAVVGEESSYVPGAAAANATTSSTSAAVSNFIGTVVAQSNGSKYVIEYPEDIQLYGVSFNTSLGKTGIALQGELSHRRGVPLQVDDVELLFTTVGAGAKSAACLSATSGNAAIACGIFNGLRSQSQLGGGFGPGDDIPGYNRKNISQFQTTATKAIGNIAGADRLILIGEAAFSYVHDMEDKSTLRYETSGTYYSGNSGSSFNALQGAANTEPSGNFADDFSWGYVVAGRLEYSDVFAGVNLKPVFSYRQDVSGISPGPGGSFVEGRKAATLGVNFDYQQKWSGGISYTSFFGGGDLNLIDDRDFMALNAKYSF